ncbi:hypothetical protein L5515_009381 [Caenorhabditis briggsae]|uniref:SPK domain-containing protein n=1 Tax=Caenorhabditis briggsae TaxID=6238 RepID=A0AAE9F402_CAEBR|nr:hypothetical protein L5515_009381 [Caenorhabditis briggsae]
MTLDISDAIRFISDRLGDYDKPENLNKWAEKAVKELRFGSLRNTKSMRSSVQNYLHRIEKLGGFSLMEKLQLVFIFSRPVSDGFVKLLKEAKFQIEQDSKKRIRRFSTEDGSIVRFSDHHPGVKYFEGVLCLNNPMQKKANNDKMAREKEHNQQKMEYDNTDSEVPLITEQPVVEHELDDFGEGAFNGHINYEELDAQEFFYPGFTQTPESKPPVRVQKRRQSSSSDMTPPLKAAPAKSVKVSTTSATEEATPTGITPDEPKVDVVYLVTHIETIAMYYDLDNLEKKASLAIGKMEGSGEKKTLSVKKFNSLIDSLLICIEENRIRRNETSIPLKSILKHLQLYLIRPLGSEKAFESICQKIQEIGDNNDDGVPPNLISESLAYLLIAIGFYNQLE